MFDAEAFLSANLQERRFRDFHGVESQNWFMLAGSRRLGEASLTVHGMASLEAATLPRYGSPQVFQTGETYGGAFLVDHQHPHDLIMAASARIEWPVGSAWRLAIAGGPVAAPAIGPEPFMHRASSGPNPTAPLGHHQLDSTHVSRGVVTAAISNDAVTLEASAFHGREPDEDRVAVEFGPIDSYAARVSWQRRGWHAQMSAARIKFPNPTEFTDHVLVTASVGRPATAFGRQLDWLVAFGVTREPELDVTMPAWLAEATLLISPRDAWYGRVEWLIKDILTPGGYDPPGFDHPHELSHIGALTIGYERRLAESRAGSIGLGADATLYARDANLAPNYGRPFSAHIFLRYRASTR